LSNYSLFKTVRAISVFFIALNGTFAANLKS